MFINRETGDIIFGENQILKARMSVEEIKASKLMELVTEKGKKELEVGGDYTSLKIPNANGHTVYMSVNMYEDKVSRIYMTLKDFYDFYDNYAGNVNEYIKVENIQRKFLETILKTNCAAGVTRFEWGRIELRAEYRSMEKLQIAIYYRLECN